VIFGLTIWSYGFNNNIPFVRPIPLVDRELIESISPVVGVQRPVPLFAFTTAGFISVPMFFWFLYYPNRMVSIIGSSAALLILLMAQSRGAYLAILLGSLVIILFRLANIKKIRLNFNPCYFGRHYFGYIWKQHPG
jgi:hypothetical protein